MTKPTSIVTATLQSFRKGTKSECAAPMKLKQTILIVDNEDDYLAWAKGHLSAPTVSISVANDAELALKKFQEERPSIVIAELRIAPFNGLELLRKMRHIDPNAMVLLTTGFPPTSAVIEAMKLGAYDFLRKEALTYELRPVVETVLQAHEEIRVESNKETPRKEETNQEDHQDSIIGKSSAMQEVFKMIGRVSRADAPVLITGESGCGKEVVANAIHRFSPRAKNEYVAINCAAIPADLLESELFGHEKGAFTGASQQRIGRFEQCDGGTLFLDEIGDMPMAVQSKILRVLQQGEYSRVGGNQTLNSDVRILAATNKDLEGDVERGKFREDLFYRLNVVRIHLPPLRDRREDIPLLVDFFLIRISKSRHSDPIRVSDEAMQLLQSYDWPGNVRELENTMQRACVLATSNVLLSKDIPLGRVPRRPDMPEDSQSALPNANPGHSPAPAAAAVSDGDISLEQAVQALFKAAEADEDLQLLPWLEREMTLYAMDKVNGNQVHAARLLGITRGTLRKRLERYEIT